MVAVLVAVCFTVIIGVAAVVVDGGILMEERRQAQAAADAAALAAAADLYQHFRTNGGQDSGSSALNSAKAIATANGYDGKTSSVVTIRISPQTPIQSSKTITDANGKLLPGYVEVVIQSNKVRTFSNIFGSGDLSVKARAVARGQWTPPAPAILLLDPTDPGALSAVGNGSTTVTGGAILVNSNNAAGGQLAGNAAISAPSLSFGGSPGYSLSGHPTLTGTVSANQTPTPDPFLYLPAPDPTTLQSQPGGPITKDTTLNPGLYPGGIQIQGQANVTMNPGIYYMQGGGFSMTGQGNLVANGVMIYNDGGGTINIAGQGSVTITPPSTGIYQGITLFQNRSSNALISVTGNGKMNISGTFYAADATLNIAGNGDTLGSQYISYKLSLAGNGSTQVSYSSSTVGRTRIYGLVE
jgi:hypothetical protein